MKPKEQRLQPWLFQVNPNPGESFGHFLGRFRRANRLSSSQLSAMLGLRPHVVSYWETPSRQRRPDEIAMRQLCQLTGVTAVQFRRMWPRKGTRVHLPTRLCPQCYAEGPWHRVAWQQESTDRCDRHQQELLTACPRCGNAFLLPCLWEWGECDRCRLPFGMMGQS